MWCGVGFLFFFFFKSHRCCQSLTFLNSLGSRHYLFLCSCFIKCGHYGSRASGFVDKPPTHHVHVYVHWSLVFNTVNLKTRNRHY